MGDKATEAKLNDLHGKLADVLAEAIQPEPVLDSDGKLVGKKFNAASLGQARQFLKDNGIEGPLKPSVQNLAKSLTADPLPFAPGEADDDSPAVTH